MGAQYLTFVRKGGYLKNTGKPHSGVFPNVCLFPESRFACFQWQNDCLSDEREETSLSLMTWRPLVIILVFSFFFFFKLFIFDCAGSSLLHRLFSSCSKWGLLSSRGCQASLFAEHRFKAPGLQQLWLRFSCSEARGIFPNQGLNLRPLHWQADS